MATAVVKQATLPEEDKKRLLARLARVEGQLRGVQKMVAEDQDCERIAQQLAAARGALNKAFSDQIACAVARRLAEQAHDVPTVRRQIADVLDLLTRYG